MAFDQDAGAELRTFESASSRNSFHIKGMKSLKRSFWREMNEFGWVDLSAI